MNKKANERQASIVWFRQDLRLADNPALLACIQTGKPVIPLYIHSPEEEEPWAPGAASRWWLHHSLAALDASLSQAGSRLILRRGAALDVLKTVARESGAVEVFWNRRYEPGVIQRDTWIKEALPAAGIAAESFGAALLHEPWRIKNQSGKPFQVFTPFWKHCLQQTDPETPLEAPRNLAAPGRWPASAGLQELELRPRLKWADGFQKEWQPGEAGARAQLGRFLASPVRSYAEARDRPDLPGTSRLSAHLHFGEIGPRQVWHAVREATEAPGWRHSRYLTELGWREFAHHLLYHFPQTPTEPLRENFRRFPWRAEDSFLKAWQRGETGYPIVDAGMRELWTTGWMHNRVRMVTASFLVKDLLINWTEGARWFWDTLVDADLAQNTLGWQWSAGCGADAAPYFRIFNPVNQGEKFDPEGWYVRKWCPELERLPKQWLHRPWEAPPRLLAAAKIRLGADYPERVLSHTIAREVALEAFAKTRSAPATGPLVPRASHPEAGEGIA